MLIIIIIIIIVILLGLVIDCRELTWVTSKQGKRVECFEIYVAGERGRDSIVSV